MKTVPASAEAAPGEGVGTDKAQAIIAARRLIRRADRAALATGSRNDANWPYPSLVLTALDYDGSPLLFISGLAEHTRNIAADSRVGLLFEATAGLDEPLSGARISLLGRATPTDAPHHRERFLARQPSARRLTMLGDFAFYKVTVERAHLVAGFGRARWLTAGELFPADLAAGEVLADTERQACEALNREGTADQLCRVSTAAGTAGPWRVTGIDPDGVDLRDGDGVGPVTARVDFPALLRCEADWTAEALALAGKVHHQQTEI